MWKQSFRQHELFIKAKLSMRHWWRSMSLHNALQESQRNWFHKTMMISSPGAPRKKKKKTLPEESNFGPWRYAADVYPTAPFRHNRSSSFFGLWLMLLGRKFRVSKWPGPFKLFQRLFFFFVVFLEHGWEINSLQFIWIFIFKERFWFLEIVHHIACSSSYSVFTLSLPAWQLQLGDAAPSLNKA